MKEEIWTDKWRGRREARKEKKQGGGNVYVDVQTSLLVDSLSINLN